MVTRELEAEEHGSKDRGATYVMKNRSASLQTERVAGWTSQGPFGSPLPRRCTCRRGA